MNTTVDTVNAINTVNTVNTTDITTEINQSIIPRYRNSTEYMKILKDKLGDFKKWEYIGSDKNDRTKAKYFKYIKGRGLPKKSLECVCTHPIIENCYIMSRMENFRVEIVGNCCIKKFKVDKKLRCVYCFKPHRNKNFNVCNSCGKCHHKKWIHDCRSCNIPQLQNGWIHKLTKENKIKLQKIISINGHRIFYSAGKKESSGIWLFKDGSFINNDILKIDHKSILETKKYLNELIKSRRI